MNGLRHCPWGLKAVILIANMLILFITSSAVVFADTPFMITSSGVGYYNIVLCDNATMVEQTAANELQAYIQKVTSVTLPIVGESGAQDKSFMVGPTAFAIANGINPTGAEQWAIKNVGNKIIVTGGRPRGTLYAVYHLLEDEIGIRWWNEWEEYVPSLSTLTITNPIDKSGTPAFAYREVFDAVDFSKTSTAYSPFFVRNRLNGNLFGNTPAAYGGAVTFGLPSPTHTFSVILPPEQYYDSHPEYYALVDGVRKRNGQLCITNSDVIAIFKQKTRDNIAASYADADSKGLPRPTMFSITPNDAEGLCQCAICQAQRNSYGDSGYLLTFVNAIAADIATTYPEVKIDMLAYWYFIDTPLGGVTPRSNVQIRYANVDEDLLHPLSHANNAVLRSKLEAWNNITTGGLIFWDYAVNYYPMPPIPSMYDVKQDYQYLRNLGLKGIFEEHEGCIDTDMWDMKVWLEAKFMENPDLDQTATMNDFTSKYYGAAASYINSYVSQTRALADTTNNIVTFASHTDRYNFFTLDYVMAQTQNLDNAAAAVASDPVLLRRVNAARSSLDRLILIRWYNLSGEAFDRSITINFSSQTSSARLRDTLNQLKLLRDTTNGSAVQSWDNYDTDNQISSLLIPSDLAVPTVPYRSLVDIPSDNLRLWNGYGGITNVSELVDMPGNWPNHSLLGHAARVKLSDISDQTFRDQHKPLIDVGLYNSIDGVRLLKQLALTDIVPDVYKLYKVGDSTQIKQHDYLYLFRSWSVQVDFDNFIQGKPEQLYDIYVSMKFKGPSYGGSSLDPDCVYIDRVILVGKGELPLELLNIPKNDMTDFSPESFRIYTAVGGVSRQEDGTSLTQRCVKVSLNAFSTETDRSYHLPPIDIGLYNPTDGARLIKSIPLSEITLNQYKVYKIENVLARPGDYIYLFRSWNIQVDLGAAALSDTNQKYDVYVSMKFEGPVFGGDMTKKDAVYIDRVVVVRSGWENETENLTVSAISSGDTHTVTNDSNMMYGKGDMFNGNATNDYIEYSVPVSQTGTYNVKVRAKKDTSMGIFQLAIGGVNQGMVQDNYSSTGTYVEFDLGNVTFSTIGNKLFRFTVTGKNASSSGYTLFTDYIRLVKVPPACNEAEGLTVNAISPGVSHTITNDFNMSSGNGDKFNAYETNKYIEYSVPVNEIGTYDVKVKVSKNGDDGIFQLAIDGTNLGATQDTYSSSENTYVEYDLGYVNFTSTGNKLFRFTITGKNASSIGYKLFTDYIKLVKMPTTLKEAEIITVNATSSGDTHTVTNDSNMSGGKGDMFNGNTTSDYIEYSVNVAQPGTYDVRVNVNKNTNRGIFQLAIDGTSQGLTQDNYSSISTYAELDLGNVTFTTSGNKLFRFTITGKNGSSSGYTLFTDCIRLIKQ